MTFWTDVGKDFAQVISYGQQVRFRYFTTAYPGAGSYYDDDVTLTKSGADLYISGIVLPFDASRSGDALLLESGRVKAGDYKLYIAGSIQTTGQWKVGLGSPTGNEYGMVDEGTIIYGPDGTAVYKKVYIRHLTTGSLAEE